MEPNNIRVLITGGTIDKVYNLLNGELVFDQSYIPEILTHARNKANVNIEVVMLKDSLFIDDLDRQKLLEKCKSSTESKVVITHGTDTMVETAKLLGENIRDKTVVLTGAIIPYKFGMSDAPFNIGFALASVQTLSPGVYIAMNGKIFEWNKIRKNKEHGEFEEFGYQNV